MYDEINQTAIALSFLLLFETKKKINGEREKELLDCIAATGVPDINRRPSSQKKSSASNNNDNQG